MTIFAQGVDVGWVLAGLVTILGTVAGVVTILFRLLIATKDQLISAKESAHELALKQLEAEKLEEIGRKKTFQEVAQEAVKYAIDLDGHYRQREGRPPIKPAAPVVTEAHSEPTEAQRESAVIATLRAKMAQLKLEAGQEPRKDPGDHSTPEAPEESPDKAKKASIEDVSKLNVTLEMK